MKLRILVSVIFLACLNALQVSAQTRILFIGNSYVASNDLPGVLDSLCVSGGKSIQTGSVSPGGFTFLQHSTNAATINAINSQTWDYVILQEQSQRPSFSPGQVSTDVYPYAALLDSMIRASDTCAKTVFYMTWGRKFGDAGNCPVYPPICTYAGMQQRLRDSYLQMAQTHQAIVAPAGSAWQEAMLQDTALELYISDQSHPNFAGTYLTASVMYATLFREDPTLLNWNGSLSSTEASFLRSVAKSVVLDSSALWQLEVYDVKAHFGYTQQGDTVVFADSSLNAYSYQWAFGDGNTSTSASPVHVYAAAGTYTVELIAQSPCGSDTLIQTLVVSPDSVTGIEKHAESLSFSMYPNPGSEKLLLQIKDTSIPHHIQIFDVAGKVRYAIVEAVGTSVHEIETHDWPVGVYFVKVNHQTGSWVKRK
jgi:hypothetical protein